MSEPWNPADAEKAAKEFCKDWPSGEVYHRNDLTVFFEAGAKWAAEMIEKKPSSAEEIQETIGKLQRTLASRLLRETNREGKGR